MQIPSQLYAPRWAGAALRLWLALGGFSAILAVGGCGGGGGGSNQRQAQPQAPLASFSVSTTDGFAPLTVNLDASASNDPDGRITSYQWTFGDEAGAATGSLVSHTYQDTGSFEITLQVTDDSGSQSSTSRSIRVRGATVSGTIRIDAGSDVDSDVNDRLTRPVGNDSFGGAQPVRTPLRLGGFVNTPGSGAENGNFATTGDPADVYFVDLAGNEQIVLSIGDPSADLDLELYDDAATPELLDASISSEPTEDLPGPGAPGQYFVRVVAVSGASNYVLSIGSVETNGPRRRAKRVSDPIVPGELIVAARSSDPLARQARRFGLRRAAGGGPMRLQAVDRAAMASSHGPAFDAVPDVRVAAGTRIGEARLARYRTLQAVRSAARQADVLSAEPNVLRRPLRVPDDEFYELQWHYPAIDLEQAWDLTTGLEPGNPEVVVAVVDTGVLLDHPDIAGRLLRDGAGRVIGYDFIDDVDRANDGNGRDGNPDDPGDDSFGAGSGSFHGTHVAGTVAADSDNGIGVAGVSWGARLMPMRALGVDGGTTFDVMQAVRYAAGLPNVSGTVPPVRADVINLSLGSDFYSESEQSTINEVRAAGVFLVASAGNGGSSVPSYPASYDGVISVSAVTIDGTLAGYSNSGPFVDLAAPGGDGGAGVLSTLGEGGGGAIDFGAGYLAGTSMAAPHVAGVIALMKALQPDLTPGQFDALLQSGELTDDAGPGGRDDGFGWGVINANKAVQAAIGSLSGSVGAVLSVSSGTLNFQSFTQTLEFTVSNLGETPVTISVTTDESWLTVEPVEVDAAGLGRYRARVDRAELADGSYQGDIRVTADDPGVASRTVTASLQVASAAPDANAGQHYVLLVSPSGSESLAAVVVNASDGEYRFSMDDVPPGDYRLFAGTDLDDDDHICDGGEACGAYPSLASPEVISVANGQQDSPLRRSFTSEFRTTATTTATTDAAGSALTEAPRSGLPIDKPASAADH